ncbi:enoyl-CoA hydratase/isomerase family protein [Enterovirga rhinocerotis]|uniref:Short chain enoyl-CoA hydratase n=1 Tax=Enterovirga rhinocerotis TaxID=1339210 RepID=A0A4R7BWV9_9HYPH|nr:enoyl-CoA hydratase/isomerase family protein [Enterovirga rhinocerotis]TDR90418.1 short chain enoyl-CoA hydratase [Enterovirga rhinocerotis]
MDATDRTAEGADGAEGQAVSFSWPEPDIALATFNRPRELNTLSLELLAELDAALDRAVAGGARCLVLTGSGRAFCVGAHLKYFTAGDGRIGSGRFALRDNYLAHITRVFDRIEALPIPVIAAINGFALGGGCEMALSCDLRIIADGARIGVPEVRIGALAGAGGVQKLHRLVGRGKAMEWILLGTHIEPADALAHGLVTAVVPADRVLDEALAWAKRFRIAGPRAVEQSKMAVHLCGDADLANARRIGLEALSMLIDGPEWQEGMAAFMQKREPRFPGRS